MLTPCDKLRWVVQSLPNFSLKKKKKIYVKTITSRILFVKKRVFGLYIHPVQTDHEQKLTLLNHQTVVAYQNVRNIFFINLYCILIIFSFIRKKKKKIIICFSFTHRSIIYFYSIHRRHERKYIFKQIIYRSNFQLITAILSFVKKCGCLLSIFLE